MFCEAQWQTTRSPPQEFPLKLTTFRRQMRLFPFSFGRTESTLLNPQTTTAATHTRPEIRLSSLVIYATGTLGSETHSPLQTDKYTYIVCRVREQRAETTANKQSDRPAIIVLGEHQRCHHFIIPKALSFHQVSLFLDHVLAIWTFWQSVRRRELECIKRVCERISRPQKCRCAFLVSIVRHTPR